MVKCEICGIERNMLYKHLKYEHNLSSTKYKEMFPNSKVADSSVSPFSKEFYISKGFSQEEATLLQSNKQKEANKNRLSPLSKEYYIKKGISQEEGEEIIKKIQSERSKKGIENFALKNNLSYKEASLEIKRQKENSFIEKLKNTFGEDWKNEYKKVKDNTSLSAFQERYGKEEGEKKYIEHVLKIKEISYFSLESWKKKGYTGKELKEKMKEIQGRGKSYWIKNFGEEEGIRRFEEWKNKVTKPLRSSFSKKSFDFFSALKEKFQEVEFFFGEREKCVTIDNKKYYLDCYFEINNKKFCLEYNGNYWHGNPLFYKGEDILRGEKTYQEIWESDAKRKSLLESKGYEVIVIWEDSETVEDIEMKIRERI